ncbi:propionyl-CoA--succinate CoA transferase, partial [Pseudomonas aeruginosa]
MYRDRVRLPPLLVKVMFAAEAADLISDGMTVGMSGFTRAGEAKAVAQALA